ERRKQCEDQSRELDDPGSVALNPGNGIRDNGLADRLGLADIYEGDPERFREADRVHEDRAEERKDKEGSSCGIAQSEDFGMADVLAVPEIVCIGPEGDQEKEEKNENGAKDDPHHAQIGTRAAGFSRLGHEGIMPG